MQMKRDGFHKLALGTDGRKSDRCQGVGVGTCRVQRFACLGGEQPGRQFMR